MDNSLAPMSTHHFTITGKGGLRESVTRIAPLTLHGVTGFAIHKHYEKGQWWLKVSHEETGGLAAKIPISGRNDQMEEGDLTALITKARERTRDKANILRAVAEYKASLGQD